jgi:hypothetical protein
MWDQTIASEKAAFEKAGDKNASYTTDPGIHDHDADNATATTTDNQPTAQTNSNTPSPNLTQDDGPPKYTSPQSFQLLKIQDAYYVNVTGIYHQYDIGRKGTYFDSEDKYQYEIPTLGIQIRSRDRMGQFLSFSSAQNDLAKAFDYARKQVVILLEKNLISSSSQARNSFLSILNTELFLYFGGQSRAVFRPLPGANFSPVKYDAKPTYK